MHGMMPWWFMWCDRVWCKIMAYGVKWRHICNNMVTYGVMPWWFVWYDRIWCKIEIYGVKWRYICNNMVMYGVMFRLIVQYYGVYVGIWLLLLKYFFHRVYFVFWIFFPLDILSSGRNSVNVLIFIHGDWSRMYFSSSKYSYSPVVKLNRVDLSIVFRNN